MFECKIQAEPSYCHPQILVLAAPFSRFRDCSRRPILENHCGLDLVSMLPPGPGAARSLHVALREQQLVIESGRMRRLGCSTFFGTPGSRRVQFSRLLRRTSPALSKNGCQVISGWLLLRQLRTEVSVFRAMCGQRLQAHVSPVDVMIPGTGM